MKLQNKSVKWWHSPRQGGKAGQRRSHYHYHPKEMPLRICCDRLFHLYVRAALASGLSVFCYLFVMLWLCEMIKQMTRWERTTKWGRKKQSSAWFAMRRKMCHDRLTIPMCLTIDCFSATIESCDFLPSEESLTLKRATWRGRWEIGSWRQTEWRHQNA